MKSIAIVAMGESRNDFLGGRLIPDSRAMLDTAEIWGINHMAAEIRCDRMVAMDPLTTKIYSQRQLGYLQETQLPIVHPTMLEGFNTSIYPLAEVTEKLGGFAYFNTTVSYAIALALYEDVEELYLFGCDFTYPNIHAAEQGRGCAEFWLGWAVARGVRIVVGANSNLLDQNTGRKLYMWPEVPALSVVKRKQSKA